MLVTSGCSQEVPAGAGPIARKGPKRQRRRQTLPVPTGRRVGNDGFAGNGSARWTTGPTSSRSTWPANSPAGRCVCVFGGEQCQNFFGEPICVDTSADPENCGGCEITCPAGVAYVGGICDCGKGLTACTGEFFPARVCADLKTDLAHCGACDSPCHPGAPEHCRCCEGACVRLSTDTNCGGCGVACQPGTSCRDNGACGFSCLPDGAAGMLKRFPPGGRSR
jgi:hypothetical protein